MKIVSSWSNKAVDLLLHFISARALFERVIGTFPLISLDLSGNAGLVTSINTVTLLQLRNWKKRMAEFYPKGKNVLRPYWPDLTPGQTLLSSVSPNVTRTIPQMRLRRATWVLRSCGRVVAQLARAA